MQEPFNYADGTQFTSPSTLNGGTGLERQWHL